MNKLKISIIILILIILVLILMIIGFKNTDNNYQIQETQNEIETGNMEFKEVTNPHMYLTVKSCIEKYISYIYQGDNESVCRIIDTEYISKYNISKENIFEVIGNIKSPVTLCIEKMYVNEINETQQEYYVAALMVEESIEGTKLEETEIIVTVKLDTNNMIYSIVPNGYGGPLYEE